jgi:hypothetical protein
MKTTMIAALLLAMLATPPAQAEPAPSPNPLAAAQAKQRRADSFKKWWMWSLVAVLTAGTITTSVVILTVPRGSLNYYAPAGTMAVTIRF